VAEMTFTIPETPPLRRLAIYTCARPRVTEPSVLSLAGRLGLQAIRNQGIWRSDARTLQFAEGGQELTVHFASGAFRLVDRHRWQQDDGQSSLDINDAQAVAIARRHLARIRLVSLRECSLMKVSRLRVGLASLESDESNERVVSASVIFRRKVGGVICDGPGGRIMIHIDQRREVTGYDQVWRPLIGRPRAVRSLRDATEIRAELNRVVERFGATTVEVLETRFGMFELGPDDSQSYLQPAFVYILRAGNATMHRKHVHVMPAATNDAGPLTPPPPKPRRLPPRPEPR